VSQVLIRGATDLLGLDGTSNPGLHEHDQNVNHYATTTSTSFWTTTKWRHGIHKTVLWREPDIWTCCFNQTKCHAIKSF